VIKQGKVRRAKLYYLRKRMGKEATNVKDANATVAGA
jgi:ribosomal protein L19